MSTELVVHEIRRFLASETPEVLCIKGRWGVGKTYAWRHYLGEALNAGTLGSKRYSYASLFGLNSLDDLRYALFEGTVTPDKALTGPDAKTLKALMGKGETWSRKAGRFLGPAASVVGLRDIGDALAKSAFMLVRDQLICLDDLERAGDGLKQRDVLGLASFLKEQRRCKVVLLLNDEAMGDRERGEFERLLEKVVDILLVFSPTSEEAAEIAVEAPDPMGSGLRHATTTLGITNIRVIKKIERLSLRLADLLAPFHDDVQRQAVVACALGGWAVFEPDHAPSLTFIRDYNGVYLAMRERHDEEVVADLAQWRERFSALSFIMADDLDKAILDGVQVGFFDEARLLESARKLDASIKANGRKNSFSQAWERYHYSLTVEDDVILDALAQGARENLAHIDPLNMSGTLRLLRQYGRDQQADDLVAAYVAALPNERAWFDLDNHHFMQDAPVDDGLAAAFAARLAEFVDDREPGSLLLDISRDGWGDAEEARLARLSADDFVALFLATEGPDLRRMVEAALRVSRNNTDHAASIRAALTAALTRIAEQSPLRARRLRAWGFILP